MRRLIIVSNRVTLPDSPTNGGLAVALDAALVRHGGLWFGWSGKVTNGKQRSLETHQQGARQYALMSLSKQEYQGYYLGFANRSLWPLLHTQSTNIHYRHRDYMTYRGVNKLFAQQLAPFIGADDLIWIHDYHLIPLGHELRQLGIKARIGFFLHTPVPAPSILQLLPCQEELFTTLNDYDVIGVQTKQNAHLLRRYMCANHTIKSEDKQQKKPHIAHFPISIDSQSIAASAARATHDVAVRKLADHYHSQTLAIGVDRIDYSKGLPQRFEAFGHFLRRYRRWQGRLSYLQIATPSRQEVPEYHDLRQKLERTSGAINGRFAEPHWVPIHYVNNAFAQDVLAGFYRIAKLALITPLRDGMNLVAKEYVASQDGHDPGVLILSKFAGAADELTSALIVNPYDPDSIVNALRQGLDMSLKERQKRWQSMFDCISDNDISQWRKNFLEALENNHA